ncbi:MAG: DUF4070 domain-containing protein [Candidatus Nealsonbacteria bacterium]|nr:DUF4070 domain-containing protein [Candidatus Nealsonbacteria bacterium]
MKILLLYPRFPRTFWGFKYALPFIGKKATFPPLGLLTVATLLPQDWEKRIIDLNIGDFSGKDLQWADLIFISAMALQKESVWEIIYHAKKLGKKIVAGGPLFTTGYEEFFNNIDHFVLGEAEDVMPLLVQDLERGSLQKIYQSNQRPEADKIPLPSWELIDMNKYASMSIQFSRGCPFNCEFCDIVYLNGRVPRVKNKEQVLAELDALYFNGWRGNVFFVDDNFIGNKIKLKREILPAIIGWMGAKRHPFSFHTQVSINLADDLELIKLMTMAGFDTVFIGIESPKEESLKGCGKVQNINRDLLNSIRIFQNNGLQVQAGFIIGFDQDTPSIFDRMTLFIQKSGIAIAMVGLLQAPPKTRLWDRMKKEGRLVSQASGDNTNCTINFVPKMNREILLAGYKKLTAHIYSSKYYYQRLKTFLKEYKPERKKISRRISFSRLLAFPKSLWFLGFMHKERIYYWELLFWCFFRKPKFFPMVIDMAIKGFHFRKISENHLC